MGREIGEFLAIKFLYSLLYIFYIFFGFCFCFINFPNYKKIQIFCVHSAFLNILIILDKTYKNKRMGFYFLNYIYPLMSWSDNNFGYLLKKVSLIGLSILIRKKWVCRCIDHNGFIIVHFRGLIVGLASVEVI